jgi:competence protein ComEC
LAVNGVHGIINISNPEAVIIQAVKHKLSIPYFFYVIKRKFYRSLSDLYPGQSGALMKGLLLGERGEISPELKDAFARCGVIHALAISGLHIGYIGIIFFVLFSLLRFNYQARIMAVLVSIFFYDLLIGFEPPIVRASLMMGIFLVGKLLQRPTDILNVISTAAIIIMLINPLELFQASFQLSFAAIQIVAFVLNLLVIPVVGIIIALGFATLIFSLFSMSIAQLYANTNMIFLDSLIQVIEQTGHLRFSAIEISKVLLMFILIYYFLIWIILNLDKKLYRKILAYSIIIGAIGLLWKPIFKSHRWMQVIFFDVGQGDAALVTFPDGKNILIDAGPKLEDFDAGEFFILPYLKREGITQLNTVILTHADNDHIGGMPSILRNARVDRVFDSGLFHESSICSTYQIIIDSLQTQYRLAESGYRFKDFENYGVYILHPGKVFINQFKDDINNCSVVIKIVYGNRSFLFTGDIKKAAETTLLKYGELLKADVLKVAHHGSRTSSLMEWLKLVHPEFAVISVGRNNQFNFPSPSVLKRLNQLGIKTIRTDLNGAVVFRTDGNRLERIR